VGGRTMNENVPRAANYSVELTAQLATDGSVVYLAQHPELGNCMAHGATPAEARANLQEARDLCLRVLRRRGVPIPEPRGVVAMTTWSSVGTAIPSVTGGAITATERKEETLVPA
jgi:predicted RNase H-like HicB family nuclease